MRFKIVVFVIFIEMLSFNYYVMSLQNVFKNILNKKDKLFMYSTVKCQFNEKNLPYEIFIMFTNAAFISLLLFLLLYENLNDSMILILLLIKISFIILTVSKLNKFLEVLKRV